MNKAVEEIKPELYEKLYKENKSMRDDLCRLDRVRDEQKRQAGFDLNVSFDVVWQEMLDVWNDRKQSLTDPLDGLIGIKRHLGNQKLIKIAGLKIIEMPECEGGGYAITGDVAERIVSIIQSIKEGK